MLSFIFTDVNIKLDDLKSEVGVGLIESEEKINSSLNNISEMLNKIKQD